MKGILFDLEEYWMIKSRGNIIVDVVKCKWSQGGSKKVLREFLQVTDIWMKAIIQLCEHLNVTIMDCSSSIDSKNHDEVSAFLGACV